jgi:hypothetical protein
MLRSLTFIFTICLSQWLLSGWCALEREVIWQKQSMEGFGGLNELRDGGTGKTLGILACEVGKGLVCFGMDGAELWRVPMIPPMTACPAVHDFGGDGREEIVVCDGGKNVYLIEATGKVTLDLPRPLVSFKPSLAQRSPTWMETALPRS